MRRNVWLSLAVAVLCISCQGEKFAEGRLMFRELLTLRDEIAKEFQEQVVDVSVSKDGQVTVKFINSPFRWRGAEEKQQRADAVAELVAKHARRPVSSVSVQFAAEDGVIDAAAIFVGRQAPKS